MAGSAENSGPTRRQGFADQVNTQFGLPPYFQQIGSNFAQQIGPTDILNSDLPSPVFSGFRD
jgi:hypothetical protein